MKKCNPKYNNENRRPSLLNLGRRKKKNYICCKTVCIVPVSLTVDPAALHPDYNEPYGCGMDWILDDGCESLISTTTGYVFYCNNPIQELKIIPFGGKIPNPPILSSDKLSFTIVMPEEVSIPLNDYCLETELLFLDGSVFEIQLKTCDTWYYYKVACRQC